MLSVWSYQSLRTLLLRNDLSFISKNMEINFQLKRKRPAFINRLEIDLISCVLMLSDFRFWVNLICSLTFQYSVIGFIPLWISLLKIQRMCITQHSYFADAVMHILNQFQNQCMITGNNILSKYHTRLSRIHTNTKFDSFVISRHVNSFVFKVNISVVISQYLIG